MVRDFHVDDAGGLRARIGEAPALEAAQVSAEVLYLTRLHAHALVRRIYIDKQPLF